MDCAQCRQLQLGIQTSTNASLKLSVKLPYISNGLGLRAYISLRGAPPLLIALQCPSRGNTQALELLDELALS